MLLKLDEDREQKIPGRNRRKGGLARSSGRGNTNEHRASMPNRAPERKPKKVNADYLHRAALYYLQRFAASRARLQEVLLRKVTRRLNLKTTATEEVRAWLPEIETLLNRYEESGLINDKNLAEARVGSLRRGGASARGISQKLKQKGFAAETIALALEQNNETDGVDDANAIKKFMQKKKLGPYRTPGKISDEKTAKKEIAALLRAGFSYQLVKNAMRADEIMPPEE